MFQLIISRFFSGCRLQFLPDFRRQGESEYFFCWILKAVLRIHDPGFGAFLTPVSGIWDPGWVKNQDPDPESGFGINIPDRVSASLETIFWIKIHKFFWCGSGSGIWNLFDPGSKMRDVKKFKSGIRDKHPEFATLSQSMCYFLLDFLLTDCCSQKKLRRTTELTDKDDVEVSRCYLYSTWSELIKIIN